MSSRKGLLVVYTGDGKGKTTAALGQALRAAGHGERVFFIQFIKGAWKSGERLACARFPGLMEMRVAGKGFVRGKAPAYKHAKAAEKGWEEAKAALASGLYGLVVLDEILHAVNLGLIPEKEVLEGLAGRGPGVHAFLTGRNASAGLLAAADLVTEMREIRHPLYAGVKAQKGMEF